MKTIIFLVSLILLSSSSWAANEGGHGGGVFICQTREESEFLDLYEARRAGLHIEKSDRSIEEQIYAAFDKLKISPPVYQTILKVYEEIRHTRIQQPPADQDLAWPTDEKNHYSKKGCSAKGVMVYYDGKLTEEYMEQDSSALNFLPKTEQAAAWVHETVYKFLRATQLDADSVRTRKIVGLLFSDINGDPLRIQLNNLDLYMDMPKFGFNTSTNTSYPWAYVLSDIQSEEVILPLKFVVSQDPSSEKSCKSPAKKGAVINGGGVFYLKKGKILEYFRYAYSFGQEIDFRVATNLEPYTYQYRFWGDQKNCLANVLLTDPSGDQLELTTKYFLVVTFVLPGQRVATWQGKSSALYSH